MSKNLIPDGPPYLLMRLNTEAGAQVVAVAFFDNNRYHVDWILYQESQKHKIIPKFCGLVVEEWDYQGKYMTDHFPIVALVELQNK